MARTTTSKGKGKDTTSTTSEVDAVLDAAASAVEGVEVEDTTTSDDTTTTTSEVEGVEGEGVEGEGDTSEGEEGGEVEDMTAAYVAALAAFGDAWQHAIDAADVTGTVPAVEVDAVRVALLALPASSRTSDVEAAYSATVERATSETPPNVSALLAAGNLRTMGAVAVVEVATSKGKRAKVVDPLPRAVDLLAAAMLRGSLALSALSSDQQGTACDRAAAMILRDADENAADAATLAAALAAITSHILRPEPLTLDVLASEEGSDALRVLRLAAKGGSTTSGTSDRVDVQGVIRDALASLAVGDTMTVSALARFAEEKGTPTSTGSLQFALDAAVEKGDAHQRFGAPCTVGEVAKGKGEKMVKGIRRDA